MFDNRPNTNPTITNFPRLGNFKTLECDWPDAISGPPKKNNLLWAPLRYHVLVWRFTPGPTSCIKRKIVNTIHRWIISSRFIFTELISPPTRFSIFHFLSTLRCGPSVLPLPTLVPLVSSTIPSKGGLTNWQKRGDLYQVEGPCCYLTLAAVYAIRDSTSTSHPVSNLVLQRPSGPHSIGRVSHGERCITKVW